MERSELLAAKVPFRVRYIGRRRVSTVTGFAANDPLGVGGGILPDMPVAYFKGGGWVLVDDLLRHYEIAAKDSRNG